MTRNSYRYMILVGDFLFLRTSNAMCPPPASCRRAHSATAAFALMLVTSFDITLASTSVEDTIPRRLPHRYNNRRQRSLYLARKKLTEEFDGKIALHWGPDGTHAPGSTIQVYEHHDKVMEDGSSTSSSSIDPKVFYCAHVAMCNELKDYVVDLTHSMEDMETYQAMIDMCEGVTNDSDPTDQEFCADAKATYKSDVGPTLQLKEYVEGLTIKVCDMAGKLAQESVFPITDETCEHGHGVPETCLDDLTLCSDGTVACSSLPYTCPTDDDCSALCGDGIVPCICKASGSSISIEAATASGGGSQVNDVVLPDEPVEEEANDEIAEKEAEEAFVEETEDFVEEAEEVVDTAMELTTLELEKQTKKQIQLLKAEIARIEALQAEEGGNRGRKRNLRAK